MEIPTRPDEAHVAVDAANPVHEVLDRSEGINASAEILRHRKVGDNLLFDIEHIFISRSSLIVADRPLQSGVRRSIARSSEHVAANGRILFIHRQFTLTYIDDFEA